MILEPQAPQPAAVRYSQKPFPPYRFIPGLNAHPTRDPAGHSFGKAAHKPQFLRPEDWQKNEHYLYGVDLYNAAFWWESHEAWEEVWQLIAKDSAQGQFLQGLIQISASFIKWHSRDFAGLEKLFSLGVARLESLESAHFMGVDLRTHLHSLRNHFHKVICSEDVSLNPLDDYPFLLLSPQ